MLISLPRQDEDLDRWIENTARTMIPVGGNNCHQSPIPGTMKTVHPMKDLNDLYYYVQVVDHGGFAPAGRALGMPKSKLSRRIALLEHRLGTQLILRSTRRFAVT